MQTAKELAPAVITLFVICFLAVASYSILSASLSKSEVVSCLKLQEQAVDFGGFYLTEWQKEMCAMHQIEIKAPVK